MSSCEIKLTSFFLKPTLPISSGFPTDRYILPQEPGYTQQGRAQEGWVSTNISEEASQRQLTRAQQQEDSAHAPIFPKCWVHQVLLSRA